MSPLVIVGILISTVLADVSHVIQGSARPPTDPQEINGLEAARSGNVQDFWWMDSNSPFKEAYDYFKKCPSKGKCLTSNNVVPTGDFKASAAAGANLFGPIDVKSNPFLNGQYESGSVSSSFASSFSSSSKSNGVPAFHSGAKIDLSNNPFLKAQFATAGNGEKVKNENGFLGVQPKKPGFATSHPLSNKKPFATAVPFGQQNFVLGGEGNAGIPCNGEGRICVSKALCVNGIVSQDENLIQIRANEQFCDPIVEVCCKVSEENSNIVLPNIIGKTSLPTSINDLLSSGKSSVTGSSFKFNGGAGFSAGNVQVLTDQSSDTKTQLFHASESGSQPSLSTIKSIRGTNFGPFFSSTPDYSNVDFGNEYRFGSTYKAPDYLPPLESSTSPSITPRPCPAGTIRRPDGSCEQPTTPSCPFGTIRQPDGSCARIEISTTPRPCPPGTYLTASGQCSAPSTTARPPCPFDTIRQPDGSCIRPSTERQCPPGTYLTGSGICSTPTTTPRPSCPFGTLRQPDGTCVRFETPTTPRPCPSGTYLTSTGSCSTPTTTPRPPCPYGTERQPDGSCVKIITQTPRPCPQGTYLTASGICSTPTTTPRPSCPFGTILQIDGTCGRIETPTTPRPCPPGTLLTAFGTCSAPTTTPQPSCPYGTIEQSDGSCRRPETPTTARPCPPGTYLTASGICSQPTTPRPSCPFGTVRQPDGSCARIETPNTPRPCPPGTYLSASGICSGPTTTPRPPCPYDTIRQPDGSCRRVETPTTPRPCPPGTYLTSSGICSTPTTPACPFGTIRIPDGSCERPVPTTTPRPYCPPGTYLGSTGTCEQRITTTTRPSCPFGTYLTPSGNCEAPTTSREYLPPVTPTQPTTTPQHTGYVYPKPTPTFSLPSTTMYPSQNNINNQYVPAPTTPPTNLDNEGSNTVRDIRLPDRPSTTTTTTTFSPDNEGEPANPNEYFIPTNRPNTRRPTPPRTPSTPYNGDPSIPSGCAAALKCVQEIYCTVDGVVSPVPVVLTKEQELLRAPTTVCKDAESGIIGKCCRDPNYKDPWPSANLVDGADDGQYKEDNFYGQSEVLGNRLSRNSNRTRIVRKGERLTRQPSTEVQPQEIDVGKCGQRHLNSKPSGVAPIDADFAEFPWQAMIARDSTRTLLCGGAIIRNDVVLTTSKCLEGLETSDVLVKGGEWKLGIDEEPLPFQIVKVAAIIRHPDYVPGSNDHGMALVVLAEKLRLAKNIGTICLPPANKIPTNNCLTTGWGKRILQLHAKNALMHQIDVKIMDSEQCKQTLADKFAESLPNHNVNTLCGFSNIDQCKVDYGSALACANDQGQYFLSGIFSWDTGCKQEGQIGGYIAPDVEWIESTMNKPLKELRRIEKEYLLKSRN